MLARSHKTDIIIFCLYSNKSLGHSQMVQRQEWIRFYQQASQLSPTAHSWMCVFNPIMSLICLQSSAGDLSAALLRARLNYSVRMLV